MGAYYEAVINTEIIENKRINTHIFGAGLKLMEHSYVGNEYVESIMSAFLNTKGTLQWLCDYHEEEGNEWSDIDEIRKEDEIDDTGLYELLPFYFIVNHSKKIYIDMKKYICMNKDRMFLIHPAPILFNSEERSAGGGDYHVEDSRRGSWNKDELEVTYDIKRYEKYKDVTSDSIFYE